MKNEIERVKTCSSIENSKFETLVDDECIIKSTNFDFAEFLFDEMIDKKQKEIGALKKIRITRNADDKQKTKPN
jgi:hypothetical protein